MNSIFAKMPYELEKHHDLMLVTIVTGDGSSPRGAGSMMLVGAKGRILGTIGGGAVEKRSEDLALELLGEKKCLMKDFELHKNAADDIGMVCGGDVTVWFQFVDSSDGYWMELCEKLTAQTAAGRTGQLVFHGDGTAPTLLGESWEVICGAKPGEGDYSVPLNVHERAIIFGGGHCAYALEPLLRSVGFRTVVMDCRPEYANEERFPKAEQVIVGDYTRISDYITLDEKDFVVIMTNGHSFDYELERQVLSGPYAYVGVIGSRSKIKSVNARLREDGISEEALATLHTPIGVSIKAVTPEEIAVSIAGEMILVRAEAREAAGTFEKGCPMH